MSKIVGNKKPEFSIDSGIFRQNVIIYCRVRKMFYETKDSIPEGFGFSTFGVTHLIWLFSFVVLCVRRSIGCMYFAVSKELFFCDFFSCTNTGEECNIRPY